MPGMRQCLHFNFFIVAIVIVIIIIVINTDNEKRTFNEFFTMLYFKFKNDSWNNIAIDCIICH